MAGYEHPGHETHVRLCRSAHAEMRLAQARTYSQFADVTSVPIVMDEVVHATREYVIVVPDDGQNMPHVLTGLRRGTNLYVGGDGAWLAKYIPLDLRRRPFGLRALEGEGATPLRHTVVLDTASPELGCDHGVPILVSDGTLSAAAQERVRIAEYILKRQQDTQDVIKAAEAAGLLKPVQIELTYHDQRYRITGFRIVDKEKLISLSEKEFLDLHEKGVLSFAYAQLMSTTNFRQGILAGQISPELAEDGPTTKRHTDDEFDLGFFSKDGGDFEISL